MQYKVEFIMHHSLYNKDYETTQTTNSLVRSFVDEDNWDEDYDDREEINWYNKDGTFNRFANNFCNACGAEGEECAVNCSNNDSPFAQMLRDGYD